MKSEGAILEEEGKEEEEKEEEEEEEEEEEMTHVQLVSLKIYCVQFWYM